MTSHELAALLLSCPDLPVVDCEYGRDIDYIKIEEGKVVLL